MRYAYPCQVTCHEGNEYVVSFPDVKGALTGANDRSEALELAGDALSVMLAGYVKERRVIPVPSPVLDGQEVVTVDPVTAAKLELYSAMRDQGLTRRALAKRMGLSDTVIGRLVDPDRHSRIDHVLRALRAVGRDLVIEGRANLSSASGSWNETARETPSVASGSVAQERMERASAPKRRPSDARGTPVPTATLGT